ncbi:MAG: DUF4349 domain-containing protein [Acidobacteriota bacterium]
MNKFLEYINGHKIMTVALLLSLMIVFVGLVAVPVTRMGNSNSIVMDESLDSGSNGMLSRTSVNMGSDFNYSDKKMETAPEATLPDGARWGAQTASAATDPKLPRKIVQNMDMSVEVKDIGKSIDKITDMVKSVGGYIVSSSTTTNEDSFTGNIVVKVPADRLISSAKNIGDLGQIRRKGISSEDVTQEFYDSQARLKVLQKKEQRMISFMDQAKKVEELIALENELTNVRSEIEVLQGRINFLNNSTTYSQIVVELIQGKAEKIVAPKGTGSKAWEGLVGSINNLGSFFNWLFIAIITLIPYLIVLGIIYGIYRLIKRRKEKNQAE